MPTEVTATSDERTARFEAQMLPHLDAAYNLARHLAVSDHDAEDIVQEAYLRALRYYDSFKGVNPRAWLLAVVRHTAYSLFRRDPMAAVTLEFSEDAHSPPEPGGPERELERADNTARVQAALDQLPRQFREVLVLRELEDLSYLDIARIVRAPTGTVMSRLSRARERFAQLLRSDGKGTP